MRETERQRDATVRETQQLEGKPYNQPAVKCLKVRALLLLAQPVSYHDSNYE